MRRTIYSLLLLTLSNTSLHADDSSNYKKLGLELYLEMESVSRPRISPDGNEILYTRTWIDKINDRRRSSIWIMNADGTRNRFLIEGAGAEWSPDGTRVAFVAPGKPAKAQIFVRWMDAEGAVTQITRIDEPPANIAWSPDGRSVAFTMLVPKKNPWDLKMPEKPEGAQWAKDPTVIEKLVYRRDKIGFLEEGYRHIFLVTADGGTPRKLTDGDFNHGGLLSWTPDGERILFTGLRMEDWEYQWRESEIYSVSVDNGSIFQLTSRRGPDSHAVVSPNGQRMAYLGFDWTDQAYIDSKLYVAGIDGSNPRVLTDTLDRSPENLHWTSDNQKVCFTVPDQGTRNLFCASLEGEVKQVTFGTQVLNVTDMNKTGKAVGVRGDFQNPGDVVVFDLQDARLQQLTHINDDVLATLLLGEVEEIWYDSVDGLRIQGWLIKPPGFDSNKKYPLILSIHGGPHSMYSVGFSFPWQYQAAQDCLVLYTNPRGSSGYGTEFGNAIDNAYPDKDYDDLMNGVDAVIAKGCVDERNLFVYGSSGGGVLTAWIVGHTDRFAAASSNCPVINWTSFVGTTDGNVHWYQNFDRLPWEDPSEHLRRSPLMYVGNVKTPTMLMTGELDLRTPISQTEEFYHALKLRKVETAMIRFKGEYHGTTSKPSNFLRTQSYLLSWFEKHMTTAAADF